MKKVYDQANYPQYRNFPLYIILCCGIALILVGINLVFTNTIPHGTTIPTKYQAGGKDIFVTGKTTIFIGAALCIFPVYQLVKKSLKSKKDFET